MDAHNRGLDAQNGALEQCCFEETYNLFLVKTDFYGAGTGAGTGTVTCQKLDPNRNVVTLPQHCSGGLIDQWSQIPITLKRIRISI